MNIQLLCTTLLLCVQYLSAAPSIVPSLVPAVVPSIVPADEECDNVRCPELDCTNVIKNKGECCDSCITVGKFVNSMYQLFSTLCMLVYIATATVNLHYASSHNVISNQ